jgi:hypothetical protein
MDGGARVGGGALNAAIKDGKKIDDFLIDKGRKKRRAKR